MAVRDRFVERQNLVDELAAVIDGAVHDGLGGDGWIWISNRLQRVIRPDSS
jgi:hypothetical protein